MKNTIRKIPESVEYQVGKTSTACDTAWTAQLIGKVGTPVFSECIQWLSGTQSLNRMGCCAQGCYGKLISVLNSLGLEGADGRCEHILKREVHGTLKKVELSTFSCTGLYAVKEGKLCSRWSA